MNPDNTTLMGYARELSSTKKGRKLDRELEDFLDTVFYSVTDSYWENQAEIKEKELEEEISSELHGKGYETLQKKYREHESMLSDQIIELGRNIEELAVIGMKNSIEPEKSYQLATDISIIAMDETTAENHGFQLTYNMYRFIDKNVDFAELLNNAPQEYNEKRFEVLDAGKDVGEAAMDLFRFDTPNRDTVLKGTTD